MTIIEGALQHAKHSHNAVYLFVQQYLLTQILIKHLLITVRVTVVDTFPSADKLTLFQAVQFYP